MELELIRTYFLNGTNGLLKHQQGFQCYTIELPWLHNEPQQSCIPEGRYALSLRYSLKHKTHLLVEGVKDRALILLHPANNAITELKGCIAPVSTVTGEGRGLYSVMAFNMLMRYVKGFIKKEPVFITIKSNAK